MTADPLRFAALAGHGLLWWSVAFTLAAVEGPRQLPPAIVVGLVETALLAVVLVRGNRVAWKTLIALDVVQVLVAAPGVLTTKPAAVALFAVFALRLFLLSIKPVRRGLDAPGAPRR